MLATVGAHSRLRVKLFNLKRTLNLSSNLGDYTSRVKIYLHIPCFCQRFPVKHSCHCMCWLFGLCIFFVLWFIDMANQISTTASSYVEITLAQSASGVVFPHIWLHNKWPLSSILFGKTLLSPLTATGTCVGWHFYSSLRVSREIQPITTCADASTQSW